MTMVSELITTKDHFDGQVVEIVLGPPPGNIITAKLAAEFDAELTRAVKNNRIKLIIVSGDGKHFSYGASVEEHKAEHVGNMLPQFHVLIRHILDCGVPTLAKVSGACLGGGFEIAMACSLLFSDERAKFAVPEIQLGVFPPPACLLLPLKIGDAVANEMILTGRQFSATELSQRGMVNRVVERENLDAAVNEFVEKQILSKSASSLRIASGAARLGLLKHYNAHIDEVEARYLGELMRTADAVEGIQAFLEKREPAWKDA
jgi:cyclohexa-1,5-dienecarbonyl-CoA hydratase